jgi:hypothetical protein
VTSPSSRRAGVVQGSEPTATGPEPSSGVGPALHLEEPAPPPRSYPGLGARRGVPGRRLAAGRLDSHLGGARTLILPGRIGPATRESA